MPPFLPLRLRARLIDDWRNGWRFWSVRLQVAATALSTALATMPNLFGTIWSALPGEVRTLIPGPIAVWLPLLFGLLAIGARLMKQPGLAHRAESRGGRSDG